MIAALVEQKLAKSEREMGENLDFVRDIYHASPKAFLKFTQFIPLTRHRKQAPPAAYFIARLVAVQAEDCGPCVQTAVNQALEAGVPRELVAAALAGDDATLGPKLSRVRRFAIAVARLDPTAEELRLELVQDYGQAAMVEIAICIATVRVFPALKRGLGRAQSCSQVLVRL